MFKIYADGQLLYEPAQKSDMLVVGPTCDAEAGLSGQLSFTMLPGHYLYDTIKKLKTEIVATLDEEEIFRGRILNWDIDFYKNKKVHCEGDISYLLDSMQPPHDLKLTATAYLTWMISEHNIQVDAPKRFTLGQITIDDASTEHDFIDASYRDTRESIDSDLINVFGGFLRTRRVGVVTYLDYLKEYTETGEQALEFGSNLIDLTQSLSSDEIFTILLPTGEPVPPVMEGAPSWPLTIESVNNGSKLLENVDAVAQFGRIVKNQFFEGITDVAALKTAGEEFLEKAYKAPFNSYTIQGLDLHLLDARIQQFKIGLLCRIRSAPHGIDLTLPIVRIAWDFDNPDATEIVIAPLVRDPSLKLTSNSGGISSTIGQVAGGKSGGRMNQLYKYYTEGENWAKIQADKISLISGDMASQGAQIQVNKDGILLEAVARGALGEALSGRITVEADKITAEVTRSTAAEGELSGRITVEADKITAEVTRATAAEGELSGRITVEADKITAEVTRSTAAEGALSGRITVEADKITAEVTRATEAEGELDGRITVEADKITAEVTRSTAAEGELSGRITVEADKITAEVTRSTAAEGALSGRITVEADKITAEVTRSTAAEGALSGRITVEADKITAEVTRATEAEGELDGRITVEADKITAEVTRATAAEGALSGRITVEADKITAEVTRSTAAEGALSGRITVEADKITAEVTRATEAEGELDGRITVEADKITAEVTRATEAEGELDGRITVEADKITAEVTRATAAEGELSGRITVEADKITAEVTRSTAAEGELSGRITVTESEIDLRVTKKGVITAINVAPGVVTIDAAKLNISGIVTAGGLALEGDLSATNALIANLRAGNSSFTHILSTGHATINGTLSAGGVSIPGGTLVASEVSGTKIYGGTIYQSGTALNDLFSPIGHGHTTLGALTLSSLTVSGTTTLGVVGASSLSTTGAITSTGGAITGVTVAGTTLKQGGTALNDLFLGKTSKAADSNKFNGELASKYVLYTGLTNVLANYSLTTHNHSGVYAPASHNHSTLYSGINHTHDFSGSFSALGHTHAYSLETHTHSGVYLPVGSKAADSNKLNGELASKYVLYTGLNTALANYSLTTHNHSGVYLPVASKAADSGKLDGKTADKYSLAHTHPYAASGHNHSTLYSGINHTHDFSGSFSALGHTHAYSLETHTHAGLHTDYSAKSKSVLTNYQLTVNSSGGVVTSVSGKKTSSTIYYLGKDS